VQRMRARDATRGRGRKVAAPAAELPVRMPSTSHNSSNKLLVSPTKPRYGSIEFVRETGDGVRDAEMQR
jgi:hypothetical protein